MALQLQKNPRSLPPTVLRHSYEKLNPKEIRVLILLPSPAPNAAIRCELFPAAMTDNGAYIGGRAIQYQALSYVWVDATDCRTIYINEASFLATTNLVAALRRIRDPGRSKMLWVDAVCINQSDTKERNHQVSMMAAIYTHAQAVLMWLGEEEGDSNLAIELLARLNDCFMPPIGCDMESSIAILDELMRNSKFDGHWNAVRKLFERPYWTRLWIVQEVVLNRTRLLLCGSQTTSFFSATVLFENRGVMFHKQSAVSRSVLYTPGAGYVKTLVDAILSGCPVTSLLEALLWGRQRLSSLAIDQVYGILSLVDPAKQPFTPDYDKATRQVFREVVLYSIETTKTLDILTACKEVNPVLAEELRKAVTATRYLTDQIPSIQEKFAPAGSFSQQNHKPWPSWVPDWALAEIHFSDFLYLLLSKPVPIFYQAARQSEARVNFNEDAETLSVSGLEFDRIAHIGRSSLEGRNRDRSEDRPNLETDWDWYYSINDIPNAYGNDLETEKAMKLLHLLGRDGRGNEVQNVFSDFYNKCWIRARLSPTDGNYISTSYNPLHHKELIAGPSNFQPSSSDSYPHDLADTFEVANLKSYSSRVFATRRGFLGRGPHGAKPGDLVCVLHGGRVPFVLRESKDDETLCMLGECYVQGIMKGEAFEDSTLSCRDFVLK